MIKTVLMPDELKMIDEMKVSRKTKKFFKKEHGADWKIMAWICSSNKF